MSTPTRTSIRDALATVLTGLTTTGSRVYTSRVYPISSTSLPGIAIYNVSEEVSYLTMGLPRTQLRLATFNVEIYVKAISSYDDDLDTIGAEVEAAIFADVELGGLVKDTQITAINFEYSGDGDQPVGVGAMTVEVQYTTTEGSLITS